MQSPPGPTSENPFHRETMLDADEEANAIVDFAAMTPRSLQVIVSSVIRRPDSAFWDGLDPNHLKRQFDGAPEEAYETFVPVWDLRRESIHRNDLMEEALTGLRLYLAERSAFLRHNRYTDIYTFPTFEDRSNSHRILRVIGHWQRGDGLTPPVFHFFEHDQKLFKMDGHHRSAVALLSKAPVFPFYCKQSLDLDGIIACPPTLTTNGCWHSVGAEASWIAAQILTGTPFL